MDCGVTPASAESGPEARGPTTELIQLTNDTNPAVAVTATRVVPTAVSGTSGVWDAGPLPTP